jgi:CMP-N-acetylneuraminic acid synthetase
MPEVAAVVHAKGTSRRVPGKNLRVLGDRPLFCWAIGNALAAARVDVVYIDSESEEILAIGQEHGALPLRRPVALADNRTTGDELARWQASALADASVVAQVIPTSPFIRPASIDGAIALLTEDDHPLDSVVGARVAARYAWAEGRPAYLRADGSIPNSDELQPAIWETTGLYVNRRAAVLRTGRRVSDRCAPFPLSPLEAIDIDDEDDFRLAQLVAAGMLAARIERTPHAVRTARC